MFSHWLKGWSWGSRGKTEDGRDESCTERETGRSAEGSPQVFSRGHTCQETTSGQEKKSHKRAEGTTLRVCRGQGIGLSLSIQVEKLITNGEV